MISSAKPSFKLAKIADLVSKEFQSFPDDVQYSLFIDGLDIRPNDVAYQDFLEVISSICNTIWILNTTQLVPSPAFLKAVLLVRPDIFDVVSIQNRSSKLTNHAHLVEWHEGAIYDQYASLELFKLTDKVLRLQQSPELKLYEGDAWDGYFPFKVFSRKTGENTDNPFIMLLRHSFYKPRDVLTYLSIMSDEWVRSGGNQYAFTEEVFRTKNVRERFSKYLLEEIRDQLSFYYTNLEYQQFLDFNSAYLEKHIDRKSRSFSYDDFVEAHTEFAKYNERNQIESLPSFRTADTLLQFLFELNVVGYYQKKMIRGKEITFTNYCYRRRSFANLKPRIPVGGEYVMHFGIAKSLFLWLN